MNEIRRGDIFYISLHESTGSEQRGCRPGIVVSNDMNNRYSSTIEVVFLTSKRKKNLPTHVAIRSTSRDSIALCEQITTVSTTRVVNFAGHLDEDEQVAVDNAILISTGLVDRDTALMLSEARHKTELANAKLEATQNMYTSLVGVLADRLQSKGDPK